MNRELILRGLTKKRLVSLAKSVGAFPTDGVTREELMNKMQRSTNFGTLALLDFLTLAELKTVARRLGVEPKSREKMILRDRIFASPMLRKKKESLKSAKPKPKPKPKAKSQDQGQGQGQGQGEGQPKPRTKPKSKPIKRFVIKPVQGRDSRDDFVYCPICGQERTFYQLARHVSRMHPETLDYQIYVRRKGSPSSVILAPEEPAKAKTKPQQEQKPKQKQKQKQKQKPKQKQQPKRKTKKVSKQHPPKGLTPEGRKAWWAAKTAEDYAKGRKAGRPVKLKGYKTKSGKPYKPKPAPTKIVSGGLPSLGKKR